MKKVNFILTVGLLIIMSLTVNSCKKDKDDVLSDNCDALATAYNDAAMAYMSDPTNSEKCEDFVEAVTKYIEGCGILTPQQKQEFQDAVDAADCSSD